MLIEPAFIHVVVTMKVGNTNRKQCTAQQAGLIDASQMLTSGILEREIPSHATMW